MMKKLTAVLLAVLICLTGTSLVCAGEVSQNSYQATVYFTGAEGLALRSSPDSNAQRVATIPEGTVISIDQVSGGWGYVIYAGAAGWVSLRFTRIMGDYPTAQPQWGQISPRYYTVYDTDGEGLELRVRPDVECSTFGPMMDNTVVKATAIQDPWVFVENNGHKGWCNLAFLRDSTPQEIASYESRITGQPAQPVQNGQIVQNGQPSPSGLPDLAAGNWANWQEAYIGTLQMNRSYIEYYDWQKGYFPNGPTTDEEITRAVAICDIYGDAIPELIYITVANPPSNQNYDRPELHILTWHDTAIRVLYEGPFEGPKYVGGFFRYYFFQTGGSKSLWVCIDEGDDGGTKSYNRFDANEAGELVPTVMNKCVVGYEGANTITRYYQREVEIGAGEFAAAVNSKILAGLTKVLMFSEQIDEAAYAFVRQNGCSAMTVEEALAFLQMSK